MCGVNLNFISGRLRIHVLHYRLYMQTTDKLKTDQLLLLHTTAQSDHQLNLSHVMKKRLFAYAKTKALISFAVTAKLISAFVFTTWIVQFLFYLNPKFQASSHLLQLYSLVCVRSTWSETPKTGFLTTRLISFADVVITLVFQRLT